MSDLTEREVSDRIRTDLKSAIDQCEKLRVLNLRGPTYLQLIEDLKHVEGAARQMGVLMRGDARWLQIGLAAERAHQAAGHWLRTFDDRAKFKWLADGLREMLRIIDRIETRATGRSGPILPKPLPAPHRDTRPVSVPQGFTERQSGLIVPKEAA